MVSVIVPVFNGAAGIVKCLESIRAQKYRDLECIIIDDGSSDGSYSLIEDWIEDDRFRLYKQENAGVAVTRDRGIKYARGEFIAFADQDDYVEESYLSRMVEAMDDGTDIVVSGYRREDERGKEIFSELLGEGFWPALMVTAPWAHLYRTDFIRERGIGFLDARIGEDVYFNLIALSYTSRVKALSGTADYVWVYHEASVSNSRQKSADGANPLALLEGICQDLPSDCRIPGDYLEYFFLRYCVWYDLYVLRGSSYPANRRVQKRLWDWLEGHFPGVYGNRYIRKKPAGERQIYHLAVRGWVTIKRMKLDKAVTRIFSKR